MGLLGENAVPKLRKWMTPQRSLVMSAIGTGLGQMGRGDPITMGPAYQSLMKRQQNAAQREQMMGGGMAGLFSAEEQAMLANAPFEVVQSLYERRLGNRFAPAPKKTYGNIKEINGQLVDMDTMEVVFGGGGDGPMFDGTGLNAQALNYMVENNMITRDEAARIGVQRNITGPNGELLLMDIEQMLGRQISSPTTSPDGIETSTLPPAPQHGAAIAQDTMDVLGLTPMPEQQGVPDPRVIVEGKEKPLTQDQAKAAGFVMRAENAETMLREFELVGTSTGQDIKSGVPLVGRYLESQPYKQLDQAKRSFINAVLRRDSGAVIGPTEFASADLEYFPQPGDGAEVIAQKRRARQVAIDALRIAAPIKKRPEGQRGNPLNLDLEKYK